MTAEGYLPHTAAVVVADNRAVEVDVALTVDAGTVSAMGKRLDSVQRAIYYDAAGQDAGAVFGMAQNRCADMFAGYFHDPSPEAVLKNSVYDLDNEANAVMWKVAYGEIMPAIVRTEKYAKDRYPEIFAMAKILKVLAMHRVCDMYGPILYTRYGADPEAVDTQEEAYAAFFADLDEATALLRAFNGDNHFASYDLLMPDGKRDAASWVKFANSLRLRLALRISMAAPASSQTQAQKALDPTAGGLLELPEDRVAVSAGGAGGYVNPLGVLAAGGRVKMNANMESITSGHRDPRQSVWFKPATADPILGQYRGMRQGTGSTSDSYRGVSDANIPPSAGAVLMRASEVWFLRAEAALRGYSAENVKTCYEEGVRCSFAENGVSGVNEYLGSDNVPADFVDPFDPNNSFESWSVVSPKWNDGEDPETKLEKIITQKWLACFPEGCEAWTEKRRTGYPSLAAVKENRSGGTIDTNIGIRRLLFPQDAAHYPELVDALGGSDNGGTRLWWDTGHNF